MIAEALQRWYPGDWPSITAARNTIEAICRAHIDLGLADPTFLENLCSEDRYHHAQGLSEALIGHELLRADLTVRGVRDAPDFLVINGDQRIWVEVICPTPVGIPGNWLRIVPVDFEVVNFPHEQIILRWTAAIKEKAEKLLGNPALNIRGYIERGVVLPDDAYVIAVNGCLLRGHHAGINGISQFPFAVESTLRLGPYGVQINVSTLEQVGEGHTWRASVPNANGAPVPTDTFFDTRFRPISAILAVDLDVFSNETGRKPMAVVHNPLATNRVASRLLPASFDYTVNIVGDTEFQITRQAGLLNPDPA